MREVQSMAANDCVQALSEEQTSSLLIQFMYNFEDCYGALPQHAVVSCALRLALAPEGDCNGNASNRY